MEPKKKCICKKCDECNFYVSWDMENNEGLRKQMPECLFFVLANEIPKLRGAVDGLQAGVNQARNRSQEAKDKVDNFVNNTGTMAKQFVTVLEQIHSKIKLIE
ncbi:MAG: hypothetical protein ACYTBV_19525 [Planctomycetota bacterium]|jgi:hypothetical protein